MEQKSEGIGKKRQDGRKEVEFERERERGGGGGGERFYVNRARGI